MGAKGSGRTRIEADLMPRVREGFARRLQDMGTMSKLGAILLKPNQGTQRRIRRETLNMDTVGDQKRWQMLHNDSERYEVITAKDSNTNRGNYCHVTYIEKGDDLPLVKSESELRSEDKERIKEEGG